MGVHTFNPSAQEAEAGGLSVSSRPARSIKQVPGQLGLLYRETLSHGIYFLTLNPGPGTVLDVRSRALDKSACYLPEETGGKRSLSGL